MTGLDLPGMLPPGMSAFTPWTIDDEVLWRVMLRRYPDVPPGTVVPGPVVPPPGGGPPFVTAPPDGGGPMPWPSEPEDPGLSGGPITPPGPPDRGAQRGPGRGPYQPWNPWLRPPSGLTPGIPNPDFWEELYPVPGAPDYRDRNPGWLWPPWGPRPRLPLEPGGAAAGIAPPLDVDTPSGLPDLPGTPEYEPVLPDGSPNPLYPWPDNPYSWWDPDVPWPPPPWYRWPVDDPPMGTKPPSGVIPKSASVSTPFGFFGPIVGAGNTLSTVPVFGVGVTYSTTPSGVGNLMNK